jgi:hypothetical protein
VAGWSRTGSRIAPLIAPGDSFVVSMTPPRASTFAMVVLEPGEGFEPAHDHLFVIGEAVDGGERTPVINSWALLAQDGADLPPALRMESPARIRTGTGETYDFVWTPSEPGDAELLVHFPFAAEPGELLLRQPLRVR